MQPMQDFKLKMCTLQGIFKACSTPPLSTEEDKRLAGSLLVHGFIPPCTTKSEAAW